MSSSFQRFACCPDLCSNRLETFHVLLGKRKPSSSIVKNVLFIIYIIKTVLYTLAFSLQLLLELNSLIWIQSIKWYKKNWEFMSTLIRLDSYLIICKWMKASLYPAVAPLQYIQDEISQSGKCNLWVKYLKSLIRSVGCAPCPKLVCLCLCLW